MFDEINNVYMRYDKTEHMLYLAYLIKYIN